MAFLDQYDQAPPDQKFPLVRGWMKSSPREFFAELRDSRPVLVTPEGVLLARYADVQEAVLSHEVFSIFPYKDKMGTYLMAQDDTPQHWREKSIMQSLLNRDDIPGIRTLVGKLTSDILDQQANKEVEAVNGVTRKVPVELVRTYMGFENAQPDALARWSLANQWDTFHNQSFDGNPNADQLHKDAQAASRELGEYVTGLVKARAAAIVAGDTRDDVVSRLIKSKYPAEVGFPIDRLIRNVGGLLIGTVETTSQATAQALQVLLRRPEILAAALKVIDDTKQFDGFVFEALRFDPISPYFFRRCETNYVIGRGQPYETTIPEGAMVLPLVLSAMFDKTVYPDPDKFNPARPQYKTFHFGMGLHECMGRYIGAVMIPEIIRQLLKRPNLRALGPIEFGNSPFPAKWLLTWS